MVDRQTSWTKFSHAIVSQMAVGDMIEFERLLPLTKHQMYSHWGVYIGNGDIAHFNPEANEKVDPMLTFSYVRGMVTQSSVEKVAATDRLRINNKRTRKEKPRSVPHMLAIIKLFEKHPIDYCLAYFNCEHFASFVRYGTRTGTGSPQTGILHAVYSSYAPRPKYVEHTDIEAYHRWDSLLDDAYDRRFPDRAESVVMRLDDV